MRVVRRVFEEEAYADRAFAAEAGRAGLDGRERALAMSLAFGAVQRSRTLDWHAERLAQRPSRRFDKPVLAILRIGLLQLIYLDGIADHAAVNETVELAKEVAPRAAGFVNAVMRSATRETTPVLDDASARQAALAHSVPDWLADMWWADLGAEDARALLRVVNDPPEHAVRVNPLVSMDLSAIPAHPAEDPPEALVLDGAWDAWESPEWRAGAVYGQSRASMWVARALAPEPGERVLDLCAAPGGKTTHLAALMGNEGTIVAVERNPKRAAALRETAARMGATCVEVVEGDAAEYVADAPFDRVLVDPPCSGLGTLQSRPDLRWRASAEAIPELAAQQEAILAAGERALRPGGALVYSVCTLSQQEEPARAWEWTRRTLPHREGTEGFFIARLASVSV